MQRRRPQAGTERKRERGAALAEMALVVTVLMTMMLGVFDFGRAYFAYLSVIQGARDGARYAMVASRTDEQVRQAAIDAAAPIAVTVTVARASGRVTVTVAHDYAALTPFVARLWGGGPLHMTRSMVSK